MNQVKMKTGTFTGAAAAVKVNLGFIPDYFRWWNNETSVAAEIGGGEWDSGMVDGDAILDKILADNGATSGLTRTFETTNGISKLDNVGTSPSRWKASTVYKVGDRVHPTTNNGYFYQCSTAGTSHSAEPVTWGVVVGGTTSEGGGAVVWTCYLQGDLEVERTKEQGVIIGTASMTDGNVYRYLALRG